MIARASPAVVRESVGQRLRRLRFEAGMTQRTLAAEARLRGGRFRGRSVTYAYVSRIESGQRSPSGAAIRLLAAALEVTPHYLEFGRELVCPSCGAVVSYDGHGHGELVEHDDEE